MNHQEKILRDTVKNPLLYLLGGLNAEESEKVLKEKFNYSDKKINQLKKEVK